MANSANYYCIPRRGFSNSYCQRAGNSPTAPLNQCDPNEYCSLDGSTYSIIVHHPLMLIEGILGECVPVSERDDYKTNCVKGQCANGLQCINGKCDICLHNSNLSFDGRKVNGDILQMGTCARNRWSKSKWDFRRTDVVILSYERVIFTILSCFLYKTRLFATIVGFLWKKFQNTRIYEKISKYLPSKFQKNK
jgi:hypothetical protein